MRLLFVLSAFTIGGTEVKVKKIANYLVENNIAEVDILSLSNSVSLRTELSAKVGFTVIDGSGSMLSWLACKGKIAQYLNSNVDYDKTYWFNYYPILMAPRSAPNMIAMLNTSVVHGYAARIKKNLSERRFKYFNRVIVGNKTLADKLSTSHPSIRGKISHVYNGVDLEQYMYVENELNKAKTVTLCMVSKLRPEKRHFDVLRAIKQLSDQGIPIRLLVVGGVHKDFIAHAEQLKCYCIDNHIEHLVEFTGETNNVRAYLQQADLFVMPSHETFSNALLEAMACGIAVLGANIGGTGELIKDRHNGYLHSYADVPNLVKKLSEICADIDETRVVSRNARRLIEDKFSFEQMVQSYLNV